MSCFHNTGPSLWNPDVARLQQDVKELRSSFLELMGTCQDQYRAHLSAVAAVVQGAQLDREAMQAWRSKALHLERSLQEVEEHCHQERQRRRALHNSLLELRGSIRVHCRIRPLLPFDSEWDGSASCSSTVSQGAAHALDDETILVKCHRPGHPKINKTYTFERVYGPAESQTAVFADVRPLLTSFLDGYDVCVMAYGQTGSGKSYTMLGPPSEGQPGQQSGTHGDSGIVPRAAEELFRLISENSPGRPTLEVSVLEIYNNDIFDLLAKEDSAAVFGVKREVVTTQEGRTEVPLLTCTAVASAVELVALVHGGLRLRARHPTLVHAASSRSHLVVTVTLTGKAPSDSTGQRPRSALRQGHAGAGQGRSASPRASPPQPLPVDHTGPERQARAKLQLVDLAGSECAGASGVTGLALRETSFINRSLAALADVLGALSERRGHVPYRNSKLTHLLQDTIGGDAKLLVILCVSPGQKHVAETLQGLGFGTRARQAERGQAGRRPSCPGKRRSGAGSASQ
ncbi:kinesin-like protein KIF25 isoform X3 [Sciurus carolinensis]|uniref:kinesin-like protein KIF25 isoform X3 n=1 Tax=Sciurus carolinensis TaxID=30640 RepID=UPI001FB1FF04|nr:kinesin-like protein KIF25 isoform X3 [Sciurus carolinensis]